MKRHSSILITIIGLLVFVVGVEVYAASKEISSSTRFTLERSKNTPPIIYYFSKPEHLEKSYPICVLCDGSEYKGNIQSVLYMRDHPSFKPIWNLPVAHLALEKWGVDGNHVDEKEFWNHYTRSQRLQDHLQVIEDLQRNPPEGWNGKLIFVGGSEGGILVTDLSILCPNVLATINFVGAGDFAWADQFWTFFAYWKKNSFWFRLYDSIPRWVPFSFDVPQEREEYDVLVKHIIENPAPNLWMGGMSYLYHADAFLKSPVDYRGIYAPFLVVTGTGDSNIDSSDEFVRKAVEAGAPITYFRIEGMEHDVRNRPDIFEKSAQWLKQQMEK